MGGPPGNEAKVTIKAPSPLPHASSGPVGMYCPLVPLCSGQLSQPVASPCPCHHAGLSNHSAVACHAHASTGPAIPQAPPASCLTPRPHARLAHTEVQLSIQDTVACDLLPFVLTLVSWCFQVNKGDSFFISDPLFQIEFNQVQHL